MAPLPPIITSPGHWLFGPAYLARRDPLGSIPQWVARHGDVCRIKTGLGQATIAVGPDLVRQVLAEKHTHYQAKSRAYAVLRILMGNGLVTSEGEFWRGQRRLVQPAFHRRRLDALFAMMVERIEEAATRLGAAASAGATIDFAPFLSQLTLDIIARAMFGSEVLDRASEVSHHIAMLNEYALRMLRRPWLFLLPRMFPTPFNRDQYYALQSLNKIVHDIIQTRRRQPGERDDLLEMLLSACAEDTGKGMTDEQLRDEVMTIFVAGHETTANAMGWLLYLVARHPEVEERLHAEIDAHWPEGGLTFQNIGAFAYTRQVIEESLRLYPTIWSVGRSCAQEDELGGFRIPKGMNVLVPIFYLHWSERFWSEPTKFDPARFSPERRPPPETMTYLPFGAGPRGCIGNHFALQELTLMTLLFHRHFQFRVPAGFEAEAEPLITLRPKHGMKLILRARRGVMEPIHPAC